VQGHLFVCNPESLRQVYITTVTADRLILQLTIISSHPLSVMVHLGRKLSKLRMQVLVRHFSDSIVLSTFLILTFLKLCISDGKICLVFAQRENTLNHLPALDLEIPCLSSV
jgi:hypothetical protein